MSLFCDTALAERIERAEVQLVAKGSEAARRRRADTAGFVTPIAGGVASFAEEGAPLNKVAGLGFGGVPGAAELDEIEQAFAAVGSPVQVELAHLADPAIGALLTDRGYRLTSFENVLGRSLAGEHESVTPPGIEIRPSGDDEFDAWLDVVVDGFSHPDMQGVPSHEEFPPRGDRSRGARSCWSRWRHALRGPMRWRHRRRGKRSHVRRHRSIHWRRYCARTSPPRRSDRLAFSSPRRRRQRRM
jgi:hypothetical protein